MGFTGFHLGLAGLEVLFHCDEDVVVDQQVGHDGVDADRLQRRDQTSQMAVDLVQNLLFRPHGSAHSRTVNG